MTSINLEMKNPIIFFFVLCIFIESKAQNNLAVFYDQHWTLHSSKYIPSKLGDDYGTFNATIMNPYSYLNNSGFGLKNLAGIDNTKIDNALKQMAPSNIAGGGLDIDIIGMSYKIMKREKEFMSFSFFATDRLGTNFIYTRDFFDLIFWNIF